MSRYPPSIDIDLCSSEESDTDNKYPPNITNQNQSNTNQTEWNEKLMKSKLSKPESKPNEAYEIQTKNQPKSNTNNKKINKPKKRAKILTIISTEFNTPVIKCTQTFINGLYSQNVSQLTKKSTSCEQLDAKKNLNIKDCYAFNANWTISDGIRELIQNFYDGCKKSNKSKTYPYFHIQPVLHGKMVHYYVFRHKNQQQFNIKANTENILIGEIALKQKETKETKETKKKTNSLVLKNYGIALDKSCLILGETSKSSDKETIGRFGEGLKMAANILLYKKIELEINTNAKNWIFKLESNELCVASRTKNKENPNQIITTIKNVPFKSINLDNKTVNILADAQNYLFLMCTNNKQKIEIKNNEIDGTILLSTLYKNKIFSDGIYIDTISEIRGGYNLNGNVLRLNRDRRLNQNATSILKSMIPKLWKYAILNDAIKNAKLYLELIEYGEFRKCSQPLELPYWNDDLQNAKVATILWETYKKYHLNPKQLKKQRNATINKLKFLPYFVISSHSSNKDRDIVVNELLRTPYVIHHSLYDIFRKSPHVETIESAHKKQLKVLKESLPVPLTQEQQIFTTQFEEKMRLIFPKLADYKFEFKSTQMAINCRITGKTIIFSRKVLENTYASNTNELFSHLCGYIRQELNTNNVILNQQFDSGFFAAFDSKYNEAKDLSNEIKNLQGKLKLQKDEKQNESQMDIDLIDPIDDFDGGNDGFDGGNDGFDGGNDGFDGGNGGFEGENIVQQKKLINEKKRSREIYDAKENKIKTEYEPPTKKRKLNTNNKEVGKDEDIQGKCESLKQKIKEKEKQIEAMKQMNDKKDETIKKQEKEINDLKGKLEKLKSTKFTIGDLV